PVGGTLNPSVSGALQVRVEQDHALADATSTKGTATAAAAAVLSHREGFVVFLPGVRVHALPSDRPDPVRSRYGAMTHGMVASSHTVAGPEKTPHPFGTTLSMVSPPGSPG